jgi:hypothetical protein
MHKKAPDLRRPMPFLNIYLGTPLDLFGIWLATQNSFGTSEQSACEGVLEQGTRGKWALSVSVL